ncbi:putative protein OS=Bosea thiooxidans OX=53254 GN=SAMN05660750_03409 PE=4 SV=1 [Bosea thiooxidans]|uniref:Uncharacterized protein n=1 Tax=Bosea thiooxidans TaxID=53254 RepID=A0A1T5FNI0_9HYPH|nr:hypothetical protein [Bosea thiooxidans]SKB97721.1 hypothetical protein SAMN05660750_03409 [Bosea thiooxidans]
MSRLIILASALMLGIGGAGCAPTIASQTVIVSGVGPVAVEQIEVEVVAVAPAFRLATVRQGRFVWDVFVPEPFGDLRRVQAGDRLRVSRVEGVALGARRTKKGARPGIAYTEAVSETLFQNLPEKFVARSLRITARFQAFDPVTGVVSYVGPAGPNSLKVVTPAVKEDLSHIRSGDMVDLTLAEAVYIQKL